MKKKKRASKSASSLWKMLDLHLSRWVIPIGFFVFYKIHSGYIMGMALSKHTKNHKILCFLIHKTLYFVVVVAEREGFEPSLLLGIVWNCAVLCGIFVPFDTVFLLYRGILWYFVVSYNGYDNGYDGYFCG